MNRDFFVFASGWLGNALLLLRLSVATFLLTAMYEKESHSLELVSALGVLAAVVAIGMQTRTAALLAGIVVVILAPSAGGRLSPNLLGHVLDSLALVMAGPGAYSIDALRFGRRTVRLPR